MAFLIEQIDIEAELKKYHESHKDCIVFARAQLEESSQSGYLSMEELTDELDSVSAMGLLLEQGCFLFVRENESPLVVYLESDGLHPNCELRDSLEGKFLFLAETPLRMAKVTEV